MKKMHDDYTPTKLENILVACVLLASIAGVIGAGLVGNWLYG